MTRFSLNGGFGLLAAAACLLVAPVGAATISYEMATIGNPGNVNDTTGYGAVAYNYQIGKYDATIGQYAAFLNAVAATDPYSLYNASMSSDGNIAGISRNGSSGSYTYSVIGSVNRPITYVSWFDAARFANWMTNGQGPGGTETGAYTLVGGQTSGTAPAANAGAAFTIPTENEWYKAAYYSPNYGGPGVGGYYAYATQSNSTPGNIIGSASNQANYFAGAGYAVTQSSTYGASQTYLTDVGGFSGSASFYGTFDQSGNVYQWNDLDGSASATRGVRGGGWANRSGAYYVSSSNRDSTSGSFVDPNLGFRLAGPSPSGVPEIDPSSFGSALALVLGSLGLFERRRAAR